MSTHLERLHEELAELTGRLEKLAEFFDTPTFRELGHEYRSTLSTQFLAMSQYAACLRLRLALEVGHE
jgi:hypothetical protein